MFRYFYNIITGLWTVVLGMKVTVKYLLKKPVTMQYPEEKWTMPERFRGILACDTDKCIACMQCANICPVSCIAIEGVKVEGQKKKAVVKFDIEAGRCIYCGLCVETCPTDAIHHTKDYEHSVYDRSELILRFGKPVAAAQAGGGGTQEKAQ